MTDSLDRSDKQFTPGTIVFNSFKVISIVGSGGMGAVYKVHHTMLDVDLALKVLIGAASSNADLIRFQNEARTLSKLSHINVAKVYDFGMEDGTPYLSMDFIEGQTLEQYQSVPKRNWHALPSRVYRYLLAHMRWSCTCS